VRVSTSKAGKFGIAPFARLREPARQILRSAKQKRLRSDDNFPAFAGGDAHWLSNLCRLITKMKLRVPETCQAGRMCGNRRRVYASTQKDWYA